MNMGEVRTNTRHIKNKERLKCLEPIQE